MPAGTDRSSYWTIRVEKGQAPATMLGTGANGMTRPALVLYPQYAEYKGSGDLKDGANWSCKAPK